MSNNNGIDKIGLCVLNSKIIRYFLQQSFESSSMGGGINFTPDIIRNIPIFDISKTPQQPFIDKAELMLTLNKELHELSGKFQRNIQREFKLDDLPKKLQNWYSITYSDFLTEIEKKKVKLSLPQKSEWQHYFDQESKKANDINNIIKKTDNEIDKMVYKLYGLTDNEIRQIEVQ